MAHGLLIGSWNLRQKVVDAWLCRSVGAVGPRRFELFENLTILFRIARFTRGAITEHT
jgi:hypothetical protein